MVDNSILKQFNGFCQRLKQARIDVAMKQQQVATYLQIPISAVSAFESGKRNLTAIELYQLSKLYNKPIQWFYDFKSPEGVLPNLPGRVSSDDSGRQDTQFLDDPELLECFLILKKIVPEQRQALIKHILKLVQEHKLME